MHSRELMEIKNEIAILPALREKADKLRDRIRDAERWVEKLMEKYKKESLDVEQLKNSSFSAFILKLVGKYEGRLEKEEQEEIAAKLEYDWACQTVEELKKELKETERRLVELKDLERAYDAEIKRREQMILGRMDTELYERYMKLEQEREHVQKQIFEINEAIRAANRAKNTAKSAMGHLDNAEGWATFDLLSRGGIISHLAKYEHIDRAEEDFNALYSQLRELKKELSDIEIYDAPGLSEIDTTTRMVDFWFDNIFTDIRVRNTIRNNIEELRSLYGKLDRIIADLETRKRECIKRAEEIENLQNEVIMSL